jgi:hypothetical protein
LLNDVKNGQENMLESMLQKWYNEQIVRVLATDLTVAAF